MAVPQRLVPLLAQFDFGRARLANRIAGPSVDSGDGSEVEVVAMTDDEYLWEPVPGCWSVRRRTGGPGSRATVLAGAGEWGRDAAPWPQPWPPPVTTIAWRLSHLSEMLTLRADYTNGSHALTRDAYRSCGAVAAAVTAFEDAGRAWREALLSCDDAALDTVGYSAYPYGSDSEEPFIEIAWWVNQEVLHHGAEIALLRDLYRARQGCAIT
ncbi:MAG TPA: DinB family protein [Acidothermaceae bacterium]